MNSGAHIVYRCFDATGRLVYVGSTSDLPARIRSHRGKWWGHAIFRITSEAFTSRVEAQAAEQAAIRGENPRWNVTGRWSSRDAWTADDYRDYFTAVMRAGSAYTTTTRRHLARVAADAMRRHGLTLEEAS